MQDAVIVLDSDRQALKKAEQAFAGCPFEVVCLGHKWNQPVNWPEVKQFLNDRTFRLRLLLVDPVDYSAINVSMYKRGLTLLGKLREEWPGVPIYLLASGLYPSDIQEVLDKGMANHYEYKTDGHCRDSSCWQSTVDRVCTMVNGDYAGNIQRPDGWPYYEVLRRFFMLFPQAGETDVIDHTASGKTIKAQVILDNPALMNRYVQFLQSDRFYERVDIAREAAGLTEG